MKKFLVIAMVSVFAASAFALDASFSGGAELFGRMHNVTYNDGRQGSEDEDISQSFMLEYVVLLGAINIDEKTTFNFRSLFRDGYFGNNVEGVGNWGDVNGAPGSGERSDWRDRPAADRFWVDYKLMENLTLSAGRMNEAYRSDDFAAAWYLGPIGNNLDYSGGRDAIRVDFASGESMKVFAVFDKLSEDMFYGDDKSDKDADLYVIGSNIKVGDDLSINPTITYLHSGKVDGTESGNAFGLYLNAMYLPDLGVQVKGTFALYKQMDEIDAYKNATDATVYEKPMLFGGYVDGALVTETMKIGAFLAYANSADEAGSTGTAFAFGTDWARTAIIDGGLHYFDGWGTAGLMQVGLYANYKVMDDLSVAAVAAYYMNAASANDAHANDGITAARWGNFRGGNSGGQYNGAGDKGNLHEDLTMYEIDVHADYRLTPSTTLRAGAAYMGGSNVWAEDDSLSDIAVHTMLSTWF